MRKIVVGFVLFLTSASCSSEETSLKPGDTFRDCDKCPEMVVLPTGKGWVGLNPKAQRKRGLPWRQVDFSKRLAVGKFEVLVEEYYACVEDGACERPSIGYAEALRKNPAYNISWYDAQAYVAWLATKTGRPYRLLSANEWEYAARAGSATLYWWGDEFKPGYDICQGCMKTPAAMASDRSAGGQRFTVHAEPGIYLSPRPHMPDGPPANPFGLYYMLGNVGEWVEDCLDLETDVYFSNSPDPLPSPEVCKYRYYKGGHYRSTPAHIIASGGSGTFGEFKGDRQEAVGTRVALEF
ncbi:formylglycine-generating enzyme family protein [Kordiimonas sp.]|uniref:formylglycine-generating enzyme family protein n=1 Tax=Kordiimonas sp. TaxID=1970157 RepID=UPI003A8E69DE